MRAMISDAALARANAARRGGDLVLALTLVALATTFPTIWSWLMDAPRIAQPFQRFPSSRPLSVALMWCAGLGLIAIWQGNRRIAQVAAAVTMVGGLVGAVVGSIGPRTPLAIALAVAVMFFSCGFAVWSLSRTLQPRRA